MAQLQAEDVVQVLRAAGEPSRLRLLRLLEDSELTVSNLTRILGQSQPRISRHLKILLETGLVDRVQEGAWVLFRLAEGAPKADFVRTLLSALAPSDAGLLRDRARLDAVRRERDEKADAYFKASAPQWDRIRSLHVAEARVEAAMLDALGPGPFGLLADLGTGTGRILELFAPRIRRGIGIDASQSMLGLARANLDRKGLSHCRVRHGDIYHVPLGDRSADAVVIHQVLHFLDDPAGAIAEAGRILAPGGTLLVVDFAPHAIEFLREEHHHRRLGLADAQVADWIEAAGLGKARIAHLEPASPEASTQLTVTLWLARRVVAEIGRPEGSGSHHVNLEHTP